MRVSYYSKVFADKNNALRALKYAGKQAKGIPTINQFINIFGFRAYSNIKKIHNFDVLYRELGWEMKKFEIGKGKPKMAQYHNNFYFIPELKKIMAVLGRFPIDSDLRLMKRQDMLNAIRLRGGFDKVTQTFFPELFRKNRRVWTPWKDFAFLAVNLFEAKKQLGIFPTQIQLYKKGFSGLMHAMQRYHNGLIETRKRFEQIEPFLNKLNSVDFLAIKARAKHIESSQQLVKSIIEKPWFKFIVDNYSKKFYYRLTRDDFYGTAVQGIYSAVKGYDFTKGHFDLYAQTKIKFFVVDSIRSEFKSRNKYRINEVSLDGILDVPEGEVRPTISQLKINPDFNAPLELQQNRTLLKKLVQKLPLTERRAISLYYGLNVKKEGLKKNLVVTGILMGLTESRVSQLISSAKKKLRIFAQKFNEKHNLTIG